MPATKFAISVPAETMSHVDRAAKRLKMTRSGFIAAVLARVAERERNLAITREVDRALAALDEQDMDAVKHFHAARRDQGSEW
jgi:metal-responsive CopG/Arc/MetJ family transcriptional regulator